MKKLTSVGLAIVLALAILLAGLPGVPIPRVMAASIYEYYDNSDGADGIGSSSTWLAQTFTAISNHTVSQVQIYLQRESSLTTGTLSVAIKATDAGGFPTGPDLTSRTVAVSTVPTSAGWMSFNLAPYILLEGVEYAIVIRTSSASSGNELYWYSDDDQYYLDGKGVFSSDSGVNWQNGFTDYMFTVWGDPVAAVPAASTGYHSPTANYYPGFDDWYFPINAYNDDTSSAIAPKNIIHFFNNYNFSIPEGSTIDGIEVRLDAWYYQGTNGKFRVALSWNGGSSATTYVDSAGFTDYEATYFIGGPSSTWGRTWTPAEFSNANFRVKILATTTTVNDLNCRLDWLPVTVYYTPPLPPLEITTASLPDGIVGTAYSQTLEAANGTPPYTWSISDGALPGWAELNPDTGEISGLPDATGTTGFIVMVTDDVSATDTQELSITINPPPLEVITTSLPDGIVGTGYSQTLEAAGGTPPCTWSISEGALPSWASLNPGTGEISGLPDAAGTTGFTVMVTDDVSATDTQELSITVNSPLEVTTTSLPDATTGTGYSQTLEAAGGIPPYTWSVSEGGLPSWASLHPYFGEISGMPDTAGTTDFTVMVTDNGSYTDTQALSITIHPAGDANEDGNVNVLDMTRIARIILTLDPPTPGADANGDGDINVLDMTGIANIILGLHTGPDSGLKVGYSIPFTGPAAEKGRPMGDGKLDCFRYINEELGGVAGHPVEVIWRDNGYDAATALSIVNEFIDTGCLLFTTCSSSMMMASADAANSAEFPGIAVFSTPVLTNPPQHIYAQVPDYGDDWAAFASYYMDNIWQGPGEPKMALHLLNNAVGSGAQEAAEALAASLGINLVAIEEHTPETVSEIESLTRINGYDPDILYISSLPQPASIIISDAVDLGMYPVIDIACGHSCFSNALVDLAGDDAEGVYGVYPTVSWGDDVPAMAKAIEYCETYHPENLGNLDYLTTWAESLIVAEILRNAIEYAEANGVLLTPQIVEEYGIKALDGYDVGGIHGPVSYVTGDNRLSKSVRVFRVQAGELVPLSGWIEAPFIPY